MYDQFNRPINYLRVSVTDRCNLRCSYCMPESGVDFVPHSEILSYEEIIEVIKTSTDFGINKIKLTGGEPLVRKNILFLVESISKIKAIQDFGMTTNGILLKEYAADLKQASLQRINISLDTLDAQKYFQLTRGGDLSQVILGIEAAMKVGFKQIKINCVIQESPEETDAQLVTKFAEKLGLEIRYIKQMSLTKGKFSTVIGGSGGNCQICNRLRLSSNGFIYPCLFNDIKFSVRDLGIKSALEKAIFYKPLSGCTSLGKQFYNIGG